MEKTRERVFGVVVIASLCIIFGPMLFEATKQHRIQMAKSLPEAPIVIQNEPISPNHESIPLSEPYESHAKTLAEQEPADDLIEKEVAAIEAPVAKKPEKPQAAPKAKPVEQKPTLPKSATISVPAKQEQQLAELERPDLKTKQKLKPKPKVEPALVEDSRPTIDNIKNTQTTKPQQVAMLTQGYSVQLGTFGSEANANRLLNKLKNAGYPAYIRNKVTGNRTFYLVLVGPKGNQSDAGKLRSTLEGQYGLKGIVVKYQPN